MSAYDDAREAVDAARAELAEEGAREHTVRVVVLDADDEDTLRGRTIASDVTLTPPPRVRPMRAWTAQQYGLKDEGGLKVDRVSRVNHTDATFRPTLADGQDVVVLVDGRAHTLVDVRTEPLEYVLYVKRAELLDAALP